MDSINDVVQFWYTVGASVLLWFAPIPLSLQYSSTGRKLFNPNLMQLCLQHFRVVLDLFEYMPCLFLFSFFNAAICAIWRVRVNIFSLASFAMSKNWSETKWLRSLSSLLSLSSSSNWLIIGVIWRCEQKSVNSGSRTQSVGELEVGGVLSLLGGTVWAATVRVFYWLYWMNSLLFLSICFWLH